MSEASGKSVLYLLFGNLHADPEPVHEKINKQVIIEATKRPGFIPKFEISDDEIAFIALFRIMIADSQQRNIIKSVLDKAEEQITSHLDRSQVAAPWGMGHLDALKAAYERGHLEPGYDPIYEIYAGLFIDALLFPKGPQ